MIFSVYKKMYTFNNKHEKQPTGFKLCRYVILHSKA